MGTQSLLRLTATRGAAGPAKSVPSRITSPCRRLHLAVYSGNACLKSLQIHRMNTICHIRSSISTPKHIISRTISTQPAPSQATKPGSTEPPPRFGWLIIIVLVSIAFVPMDMTPIFRSNLSKDLFTPCTVISNTPISQNAFLLTIQLPTNVPNDRAIADAWHHGLWSVEVKQPQLQIARHYTPLPPPPPPPGADGPRHPVTSFPSRGPQLQFYVRRYDGGEVSTYLSRLRAGDPIEIRGPHFGFDLGARLGGQEEEEGEEDEKGQRPQPQGRKKVVFVAGGTGIAPALQAAEYVLAERRDGVDVEVLWANRSGVDCAGGQRLPVWRKGLFWSGQRAVDERHLKEEPSAVVKQIRGLQAAYGMEKNKQLEVKCAVDEEGSMIKAKDVLEAVARSHKLGELFSPSCHFHSQQQLEYSTEESDVPSGRGHMFWTHAHDKTIAAPRCTCTGEGGNGKNLLIVSGPDGFVSAFVGPKVWADGGERQGRVGGVVRGLMNDEPEIWKDWLVLKQ